MRSEAVRDDMGFQGQRRRGVSLKLYPDTPLGPEWYEGEFALSGGFARAYLIGLSELLNLGIADRVIFPASVEELFDVARDLPPGDTDLLLRLAWLLADTRDRPGYDYIRRLLDVMASWPVPASAQHQEARQPA